MEQAPTVASCLDSIGKLSVAERLELKKILDWQLAENRETQFHITFQRTLLPLGSIRTASTDLTILNIED